MRILGKHARCAAWNATNCRNRGANRRFVVIWVWPLEDEMKGKKNVFSCRILEIEGMPDIKVEQALEHQH